MNYFGILKRAYEITLKHKYLWILGLLAGGGGGINWTFYNFQGDSDWANKYFNSSTFNGTSAAQFWLTYWGLLVVVASLIILVALIFTIVSVVSRGAILESVRAIADGEKNNFYLGFRFGWHKFWRVFALGLLIGLLVILSLVVLVLPIVLFVLAKIYVLAVIYGIPVFLACLVFWLYLGIMGQYILRGAVLGGHGSWEAIISSWDFFKKHWKDILVIYLILLAVGIGVGIGMLLVLLIIGGLLFAIGYGLYLASMAVFWMYVAVFGFAFLVLMLTLGGIISTFNSTVYTLAYLEMIKKD